MGLRELSGNIRDISGGSMIIFGLKEWKKFSFVTYDRDVPLTIIG